MKKKLLLTGVVAIAITSLLLLNNGISNKKEALESSTQDDAFEFVVGFDCEYPPYGYLGDNGDYTGFDLEMAKLVCAELGWTYKAQPITWSSKDLELNSGNIDCIWNGFSITPERLDEYAWSDAYVNNSQVIVVKASSGITSLEELSGTTVAVQSSSAALEALKSDDLIEWTSSFARLSEVIDYNSAFMDLEMNTVDAIAIDIGVANYQIEKREAGQYIILSDPFFVDPYGIGFRFEDTELRDTVNAELLKLVESGVYQELAEEFGIDSSMLALIQD